MNRPRKQRRSTNKQSRSSSHWFPSPRLSSIRPLERRSSSAQPGVAVSVAQAAPNKSIESILQGTLDRHNSRDTRPLRIAYEDQYHRQTRRPLVCLLFALPFILIYETTTLTFSEHAIRSGMDQWMVHLLSWFGLGELVILPLVTTGILLAAHHRWQDSWKFHPTILGWMCVESFGLGLMLFWAANAFYLVSQSHPSLPIALPISPQLWWGQTIALVGSGIYEELLFRLILLTLATQLIFRWYRTRHAYWAGIFVVSLLFACLHYDFINPAGAAFDTTSFLFRFLASVVFSLLFLFRGFGIAVGTHIAFDVLTQI